MEKTLNDLIKISKKYKKQKDLEHLEVEYLSVFYEGKDFGNYLYKHLSPYFVSNGSSMGEKIKFIVLFWKVWTTMKNILFMQKR